MSDYNNRKYMDSQCIGLAILILRVTLKGTPQKYICNNTYYWPWTHSLEFRSPEQGLIKLISNKHPCVILLTLVKIASK